MPVIEDNARTSRISPFGLRGENTEGRSPLPAVETIKRKIHKPHHERQLQRPSEILYYPRFSGAVPVLSYSKGAFLGKKSKGILTLTNQDWV